MKFLLTKLLIVLILLPHKNVNIDAFMNFIGTNLYLPESVKRVCTWQYAIVKVETDNNIITSYHVENEVSNEFKNSFKFLKGYKFDKNKLLNNRSVIFCVSLENQRIDNCDIQKPANYKHEEAIERLKLYKLSHTNTKPRNLYINKIITQIIYDPIK